ncbi:hypothetical protein [Alsobacter sp. SYSU BS001988]
MAWDMNALEKAAGDALRSKNTNTARDIYLVMGDGDPSLGAGYLAHRIGLSYEAEGRLMEAKYWFNRAVEENPTIALYVEAAAKYKVFYPDTVKAILGDTL